MRKAARRSLAPAGQVTGSRCRPTGLPGLQRESGATGEGFSFKDSFLELTAVSASCNCTPPWCF